MARALNVDSIIGHLDRALRAVGGATRGTGRAFPAETVQGGALNERERAHAAGLMRVNHAGEVAAQALYHGQSLTARAARVRDDLQDAAAQEEDHLRWCRRRLEELDAAPSLLDPLWYAGSFAIGAAAGLAGDRVSLGFLAETERQVEAHLGGHLQRLPADDARSRAIVEQMKEDEAQHARHAQSAGASALPSPVKKLMAASSKLMTGTAYWL